MYAAPLSTGRNDLGAVNVLGETLLSQEEIHRVFWHTPGAFRLLGEILYATGLRLEELLAVRVRDVDADGWCLVVRDVKGQVVRRLRLPLRLREALQAHLQRLQAWHSQEMERGGGEVDLKGVDVQEHPLAGRRWCWQYVFPSAETKVDPATGRAARPHLETSQVQAVLAEAGRAAGIAKPVHAQSLRHAFALQYLNKGRPIVDLQRLLGHTNPATTQRYIEVLQAADQRRTDVGNRGSVVECLERPAQATRQPLLAGLDFALAS